MPDGRLFTTSSKLYPTRLAGYLLTELGTKFSFCEMCMLDGTVYDPITWNAIVRLTDSIQNENDSVVRLKQRVERVRNFFDYLRAAEERWVVEANRRGLSGAWAEQPMLRTVTPRLEEDFARAVASAERQKIRRQGFRRDENAVT